MESEDDLPITVLIDRRREQGKEYSGRVIESSVTKSSSSSSNKDASDDENVPISALIAKRKIDQQKEQSSKSNGENGNVKVKKEVDSDDDLPVLELIKKRRLEKSEQKSKNVVVKSEPKSFSATQLTEAQTARMFLQPKHGKASRFYDTNKGQLVQSFLIRWWYSYEWPKAEDIGQPPPGAEPLDGFPGVFVSTAMETLGTITDLRKKDTCPCLKVFGNKSSAELKSLAITAIENQRSVVMEVEPDNEDLLSSLKVELRRIKAIDAQKADHEARKFSF